MFIVAGEGVAVGKYERNVSGSTFSLHPTVDSVMGLSGTSLPHLNQSTPNKV